MRLADLVAETRVFIASGLNLDLPSGYRQVTLESADIVAAASFSETTEIVGKRNEDISHKHIVRAKLCGLRVALPGFRCGRTSVLVFQSSIVASGRFASLAFSLMVMMVASVLSLSH